VAALGLLLGVMPDQTYASAALRLDPGDVLLLATDGVTEARRGGDLFGYDRMADVARRALALGSLSELGAAVMEAAHAFAGGALHDDACLLLAQRL
jgi:sigma-B regulation protein RsbU (phosphoserine phosphatase)